MCPITVADNVYAVLCCDPSDADSRCAAADCTKSYTTLKHKWFNSCPNISVAQCGGKNQTLVADSGKGVFGLKNMFIETVKYKTPKVDTCWFKVMTADVTERYTSHKLNVKFTRIDGMNIFLNKGADIKSSGASIIETDGKAVKDKTYTLDQETADNILVTVYPDALNYDTAFEFEYWVEGEEVPITEQFITGLKDGEWEKWAIVIGAGVLIIFSVICCCMKCGKKNNTVEVEKFESLNNPNGITVTESAI